MNAHTPVRTLALAGIAVSILLTACGEPGPETTSPAEETQASTAPSTDPKDESAPADPSDAGLPADPAQGQQESAPPEPMSTREPLAAGELDGAELNDSGVAWFGAFCSGIGELSKFGIPETEGLSVNETANAIGATYAQFGEGFDAAAAQLTPLDTDMNFDNADAFAAEAVDSIEDVAVVYSDGAETLQAGSYANEDELLAAVEEIEKRSVESGAGDYGLVNIKESVFDAVNAQVPACATPGS